MSSTSAPPTEGQIQDLIAAIDSEIVDALEARGLARQRILLHVGLSEANHPSAARFGGAGEDYERAEQRVTDLELRRAGLNAAECYTRWHDNHAKLEAIQSRIEPVAVALVGYEDVRVELNRREMERLRAGGANMNFDHIPPKPDAEYLAAFPQRLAAYEQLVAEHRSICAQANGVNATLDALEKKYGAALVHALAGS